MISTVKGETEAKEFHLVGESIGGTVVMALALANPQRVKSLTNTNAAPMAGASRT